MKLTLSIVGAGHADVRARSHSLERGDFSIGRAANADWVLNDPDRIVSKLHCRIAKQSDRFVLTDTSTNGVFVNGSETPLGADRTAVLHDGDTLQIGNFTLAVTIDPTSSPTESAPLAIPDELSIPDRSDESLGPSWLPPPDMASPIPELGDAPAPGPFDTGQNGFIPVDREFFSPAAVRTATPDPASAKPAPGRGIPVDWFDAEPPPVEVPDVKTPAPAPAPPPAPTPRSPLSNDRRDQAFITGLSALIAGDAAIRATFGCASPDAETETTAVQKTLRDGDAAAVTDVLAASIAHQAALEAALDESLRKLDPVTASSFRKIFSATYRQIFELKMYRSTRSGR